MGIVTEAKSGTVLPAGGGIAGTEKVVEQFAGRMTGCNRGFDFVIRKQTVQSKFGMGGEVGDCNITGILHADRRQVGVFG